MDFHDRVSGLYRKAYPNAAPGDQERDKIKKFCRGISNKKLGLTTAKKNVNTYLEAIDEANGTAWIYNEYPEEGLTNNTRRSNRKNYNNNRVPTRYGQPTNKRQQPTYGQRYTSEQRPAGTNHAAPPYEEETRNPAGIRCDKCKRAGHTAQECRSTGTKCYNCGEEGHFARSCTQNRRNVAAMKEEVAETEESLAGEGN